MAQIQDTNHISSGPAESSPGPFLAKVVSHLDPTYMGILEVEILRPTGNSGSEGQLHQVKYMSPFWGQTSEKFVKEDPDDYNNTQKSYGMWFIPPDVGATVVIFFIDGDPKRGYWMGCVPDEATNFMVPGIAATSYKVDGPAERVPVAEYNKVINTTPLSATKIKKPKHPLADVLETQGLLKDDTRGITTSSARREVPSMVFGISTPGPVDKRPGAPTGAVGKTESVVKNAPISRLGGTTFVMDDGDDKFLRKTHAKDGPPEYANVSEGEKGGKPEIPHNELFRIRTRTGHQILLHNSEDLIYIANSRGTAWIELTSNGKIDIYAADSISMHTVKDFNITADGDINLTSTGGNINLNAATNFNAKAGGEWNIKAGGDGKLTAGAGLHIKSGADSTWTGGGQVSVGGSAIVMSGGSINLNGPAAPSAAAAADAPVAPRVPNMEPWAGHENLHETALKYTTSIDPFSHIKGAEEEQQQ